MVHYEDEKTAPPVSLLLSHSPQVVRLLLVYDKGLLSFYDVTKKRHIYSFTKCAFTDRIYPIVTCKLLKYCGVLVTKLVTT